MKHEMNSKCDPHKTGAQWFLLFFSLKSISVSSLSPIPPHPAICLSFWDGDSLFIHCWPSAHYGDQGCLKIRYPPACASASLVLGLKACATVPGFKGLFLKQDIFMTFSIPFSPLLTIFFSLQQELWSVHILPVFIAFWLTFFKTPIHEVSLRDVSNKPH